MLYLANIVEREVEHLEILKLGQCRVDGEDALVLHVEIAKEVDDVVFHADVLDWAQLLDDLGEVDCFGRPVRG